MRIIYMSQTLLFLPLARALLLHLHHGSEVQKSAHAFINTIESTFAQIMPLICLLFGHKYFTVLQSIVIQRLVVIFVKLLSFFFNLNFVVCLDHLS